MAHVSTPLQPLQPSRIAPGVLTVVIEVRPEGEDLLNRWYDEEHIADRLAIPGFRDVRCFKAADGSPRFLALWDLDDASLPMSSAYLDLPKTPSATNWSKRLSQVLTTTSRACWAELPVRPTLTSHWTEVDTPPPGWVKQPGIHMIIMGVKAEDEHDFNRWYDEEHVPELLTRWPYQDVRRFRAIGDDDPAKYMAVWEIDDVNFQQRPDRPSRDQSAWTRRISAYRTSVERSLWVAIPRRRS